MHRERDPAGHSKHPATNEGGLPDDKSLAITEMRKKVAYKANWSHLLLTPDWTHSVTVCFIRHIQKSVLNFKGCVAKRLTAADCKSVT